VAQNLGMARLSGTGIWSPGLRYGDAGEAADAARELEELGYTALWVPDVGGDLFAAVERLLQATDNATVATGILNLWMHEAHDTAEFHARMTQKYGGRFLVGIGVSHQPLIDHKQPGRYQKPLSAMAAYLDGLDAASPPLSQEDRVLAALGPKMLELARERAAGVHPYNVTPEHTRLAREAVGPGKLVLTELAVALVGDAESGRALGRQHLEHYLGLPNYTNNLRRLGFGDEDFAGGGSDRLIDALVAWGDEETIAGRVREHRDAGADHVCIQVLSEEGMFPRRDWRALAPAVTGS
jgi:probable F420-dependent oxidoreductase